MLWREILMERHDAEMGIILANSKHQAVNNYKKLIAAAAAVAKDEFFPTRQINFESS